jgi:hypothetical protein
MSKLFRQLLISLLLAVALSSCKQHELPSTEQRDFPQAKSALEISNAAIEQAFYRKLSDVQVIGKGAVVKLLADDNKGSRHQKFLVKINPEQTLLIAHNIDLAPRVPLKVGDEILFSGEYVYNPKGGIIHWTHHAPQGNHEAGWVMLNGQKYQ